MHIILTYHKGHICRFHWVTFIYRFDCVFYSILAYILFRTIQCTLKPRLMVSDINNWNIFIIGSYVIYFPVVVAILDFRSIHSFFLNCWEQSNHYSYTIWVQARLLPDLTIYLSNTTGVLLETGTAYFSRESGFTSGFWWGPCC